MKKEKIGDYLNSVSKKLSSRNVVKRPFAHIRNFPLLKGQGFYVLDYQKKNITFLKGILELLGYTPEEFTFDLVTGYFHPDDYDIITRLIKATLLFATENNVSRDVAFFVTYRIRHKKGHYVKVLRQSTVFDLDENGKIISNLSVLSDISFLSTSNKVDWKFEAPGLDQKKFKAYVTKEYQGFFSERELEILKLLKDGATSSMISKKLFISKHTVDGHRRNMIRKSNCTNTIDLINFSKINGLL
ncbi:MAG: hypothetical protein K0S32_503 [Bacteroidetes bacterium]|jgi:DNA-binding CsgD family transcriptional regulator|nr:hypothetical protein [Bacteroidota bacterium]